MVLVRSSLTVLIRITRPGPNCNGETADYRVCKYFCTDRDVTGVFEGYGVVSDFDAEYVK